MSLTISKLAEELKNMVPVLEESKAIDNFTNAFADFFMDSTVNGVEILSRSVLAPATTAMKSAMTGLSIEGQGAQKMVDGINAFWGSISTTAPTVWVLVPPLTSATPPVLLSNLLADILDAGNTNVTANDGKGNDLDTSAQIMAEAIQPNNLGGIGIVTVSPPVSFPIL